MRWCLVREFSFFIIKFVLRWRRGFYLFYYNTIFIVIGNWKVVGKVVGSSFIYGWTYIHEDTSTQATSEYIKRKHWKYRKIKNTVLFMWSTSWGPGTSSFHCSDINLFLIDYAWCKLSNKWLLHFENNSRSLILEEKHCCSYYST